MGRVKKALLLAFVLCLLCSCGQPELPECTLFKRVTEESEDTPLLHCTASFWADLSEWDSGATNYLNVWGDMSVAWYGEEIPEKIGIECVFRMYAWETDSFKLTTKGPFFFSFSGSTHRYEQEYDSFDVDDSNIARMRGPSALWLRRDKARQRIEKIELEVNSYAVVNGQRYEAMVINCFEF